MEYSFAAASLAALGHEGRLAIYRLLVAAGPDGVSAGDIARHMKSPPSTTTANLGVLSKAGLTRSRREGRSIIYSADFAAMTGLLNFMMADCCGGKPEICAPLSDVAACGTR